MTYKDEYTTYRCILRPHDTMIQSQYRLIDFLLKSVLVQMHLHFQKMCQHFICNIKVQQHNPMDGHLIIQKEGTILMIRSSLLSHPSPTKQ